MDKLLAWVLFWILLVVAVVGAASTLKEIENTKFRVSGVNPNHTGDTLASRSMDLWFQSLSHQKKAQDQIKRSKPNEALSELDKAIEAIDTIRNQNPGFNPLHTKDKLGNLKTLKEKWQKAIRSGKLPISSDHPQTPETIPSPFKVPAIGDPTESMVAAPPLKDALPIIGSQEFEFNESPPLIGWEKNIRPKRLDPSTTWYRAYSTAQLAKALELKGDHDMALQKYEESKTYYDILNQDFPKFQSEHIKNGSQLLAAKLSEKNGVR